MDRKNCALHIKFWLFFQRPGISWVTSLKDMLLVEMQSAGGIANSEVQEVYGHILFICNNSGHAVVSTLQDMKAKTRDSL